MFSITYIQESGKLQTVTHPSRDVIETLYWSLKFSGYHVRAWNKDKTLMKL